MINDAAEWIAVIDDDYALRYSLARFFKAHGILAEPYATADDYVDRPLRALPRCIVLDVQLLTGMSSFELVDWMNAQGKKVPVIFMTGLVDQNPELCARYPELRDTLSKPFDPERLIARVRGHLQVSRSVARSIATAF